MTVVNAVILGLDDVLDDPRGIAEYLVESRCIFGLIDIEVRIAVRNMVVFWLTLEPWTPMAERGYPTEHVSITVWPGGRVTAVPIAASGRGWEHRNLYLLGDLRYVGDLCLWYPRDPRTLRWEWSDGLVSYVTIVHRHLQAEEFFRRNGTWPSEDAPHGAGYHPIRTLAMRQAALEGAA